MCQRLSEVPTSQKNISSPPSLCQMGSAGCRAQPGVTPEALRGLRHTRLISTTGKLQIMLIWLLLIAPSSCGHGLCQNHQKKAKKESKINLAFCGHGCCTHQGSICTSCPASHKKNPTHSPQSLGHGRDYSCLSLNRERGGKSNIWVEWW